MQILPDVQKELEKNKNNDNMKSLHILFQKCTD